MKFMRILTRKNEIELDRLCRLGEKADQLTWNENPQEARKIYNQILNELKRSRCKNIFLFSKLTLGLLLALFKENNIKLAHELWTAKIKDRILKRGIAGLDSDRLLSERDRVIYCLLCACLNSLSWGNKKAIAARLVSDLSSYAYRTALISNECEDWFLPMILSNWRHCLSEIFGTKPPGKYLNEIKEAEKYLGFQPPRSEKIILPLPQKWKL